MCSLFSCWKHLNFLVIYVALALRLGFSLFQTVQISFLNWNTHSKTQSWPLRGETSAQWTSRNRTIGGFTPKAAATRSPSIFGKTTNPNLHLSSDPIKWSKTAGLRQHVWLQGWAFCSKAPLLQRINICIYYGPWLPGWLRFLPLSRRIIYHWLINLNKNNIKEQRW